MFMDPIFIGIYVVELTIKMYALRLYFFKDGWNWFGRSTLTLTCRPSTVSLHRRTYLR